MEGRVQIRCVECGLTRDVAGEIPEEYTAAFVRAIEQEGFVPRPGGALAFICGACVRRYAGHETMDDEDKVQGKRDPKSL